MRIHVSQPVTTGTVLKVTFSERNLRALLSKLEMPGSARTIQSFDSNVYPYLSTFVTVERDEDHYKDRSPGRMHPDTEASIT